MSFFGFPSAQSQDPPRRPAERRFANIVPEMPTADMCRNLRDWADHEEKTGATYRAKTWRIVAKRLEQLEREARKP